MKQQSGRLACGCSLGLDVAPKLNHAAILVGVVDRLSRRVKAALAFVKLAKVGQGPKVSAAAAVDRTPSRTARRH
ncbi:MAG TPA: hypothetical protein VFN84_00090 [Pseudolabrys sp.]|nr:hypothetical protein [Pseudolabrys sp.]